MSSALEIECRICGAGEGSECRTPGGLPHHDRVMDALGHGRQNSRANCIQGPSPKRSPPVTDGCVHHTGPQEIEYYADSGGTVTLNSSPPPAEDMLTMILQKQADLMRLYGEHPDQLLFRRAGTVEQIAEKMCLAAGREIYEILDELPWRSWRPKAEVERAKLLEEVVDALHFLVALAILFDCDATELYRLYAAKNQINIERINARISAERGAS